MTGFLISPDRGHNAATMKQRIADLVARERAGYAPVVVRFVEPENKRDRGELCEIVLAALTGLPYPSNAGNLARVTDLSKGMVTECLRLLTERGRVVEAGERMRSMSPGLERTWTITRGER